MILFADFSSHGKSGNNSCPEEHYRSGKFSGRPDNRMAQDGTNVSDVQWCLTTVLQNVNISLASRHLLELETFRGLEYAEKTRTFI